MIQELGWKPLQQWRREQRDILIYKILNNLVAIHPIDHLYFNQGCIFFFTVEFLPPPAPLPLIFFSKFYYRKEKKLPRGREFPLILNFFPPPKAYTYLKIKICPPPLP